MERLITYAEAVREATQQEMARDPSVVGRSWGQGAQHSQGLQSLFMHVPGLKVVAPTTPYDAKGCLIQSIRDDNPVIFVEHRMLHSLKGHVPAESYPVPLGRARVLS